jgi:hypothetical protein
MHIYKAPKIKLESIIEKNDNQPEKKPELRTIFKNTRYIRKIPAKLQMINKKELPGVLIMAPDGELINAGIAYADVLNQSGGNRLHDENDQVIYRLYESVLPFLYFTNKLDKNLQLNFENVINKEQQIGTFEFCFD